MSDIDPVTLGTTWIRQLAAHWSSIRRKREKELDAIAEVTGGDLETLVQNYIVPNCQQVSPIENAEDIRIEITTPVLTAVTKFLQGPNHATRNGSNQLFVLADAGMGKSSLLAMLAITHLGEFWPQNITIKLFKLLPDTLQRIPTEDRRKTVLLLDALDEDPVAWRDVSARLKEILTATKSFHRVIVTCRTQFFPRVDGDPFERPGVLQIGDFSCPLLYLSYFNDEQVMAYLSKRFPGAKNEAFRERAARLTDKMSSLRFRPMLLTHIEDLMDASDPDPDEYFVYNALIEAWLRRESRKLEELKATTDSSFDNLRQACAHVAKRLFATGREEVTPADLAQIGSSHPGAAYVPQFDVGGRSLLNKNSRGNFRFAHYSVQEFLVVQALLRGERFAQTETLGGTPGVLRPLTQFQTAFLRSFVKRFRDKDRRNLKLRTLSFDGLNLVEADFEHCELTALSCVGSTVTGANFDSCDLRSSNFTRASGDTISLRGADLSKTIWRGVNFTELTADRATLNGAALDQASLRRFSLRSATLRAATITDSSLEDGSFHDSDLSTADLKNATLRSVDFTRARLRHAKLDGASVIDCDFSGADLTGATLNGLRIESARVDGTKLTSAQAQFLSSREVNLERATIFDELVRKDRRTFLVSTKRPHFVEYDDDQGNVVTATINEHSRASVRNAYFNLEMLLNAWVQSLSYEEAIRRFGGLGIPVLALASEHGDSYLALDIIAHVAFDRVPRTRHERIAELRASSFLNRWAPNQRKVLDTLVKNIEDKTIQSAFIESNALQPIVESLGGTKYVFQVFGGEEFYRNAVKDLERALLTYL